MLELHLSDILDFENNVPELDKFEDILYRNENVIERTSWIKP